MLTKLHNLFAGWYADAKTWCMRVLAACASYALMCWQRIKKWAIADWNATVEDYHAACDWLFRQLKKALRTVD